MALLALVVLSFSAAQAAPVVGDLNSANNNLSRMVSVSYPGEPDGTNADLNRATDYNLVLKEDAKDCTCDWGGGRVYAKGTYHGYFLAGDNVYCSKAAMVETETTVTHVIVRARCGNKATGTVVETKPPPCEPQVVYRSSPPIVIPPPPPLPPAPTPPPVIKVECPAPQCQCPAPVVNNYLSCPVQERVILQPRFGAQRVFTRTAGADIAFAWWKGGNTHFCNRDGVAPPFPHAR